MALLKRMSLQSENEYKDSDSAARLLEERGRFKEALEFLRPLSEASPWDAGYKVRLAKAELASDSKDNVAVTMLGAVAADEKAPYAERVSAAVALKGHGAAAGSEELKLLAQAGCAPPESVSKPYFVEARVAAAACTKSKSIKESLLRDAIGAEPSNARVRLLYVWSAFDAGADARALVAADWYLQNAYASGDMTAEEDADSSPTPATDDDMPAAPSYASLKRADKIRLLQLALAAYEKRHDFANASRMVSLALEEAGPESKLYSTLEERKKQLDTETARAQENQSRAPNIRAELDQDRIVRPRLLPGMPVPPQPAKEDEQ